MVKINWCFFIFTLFLFGCSAHSGKLPDNADITDKTGSDIEFVSSGFSIIDFTIVDNGAYSGDVSSHETAQSCRDFWVTDDSVKSFFLASDIIDINAYQHELVASNCYASGTFLTADGKTGSWQIDRARRGFLAFQEDSYLYYCHRCRQDIYYAPCDVECVHGEEK